MLQNPLYVFTIKVHISKETKWVKVSKEREFRLSCRSLYNRICTRLKLVLSRYFCGRSFKSNQIIELYCLQPTGDGLKTVMNWIRLSYNRPPTIITETGLNSASEGLNDTSRITLYHVSIVVDLLDILYLVTCIIYIMCFFELSPFVTSTFFQTLIIKTSLSEQRNDSLDFM